MKLFYLFLSVLVVFSCASGIKHSSDIAVSEPPMFDYENLSHEPFYETPVVHYMTTSTGGVTSVAGKVVISKSNLIIQMDSKIEIQQGLVIDKLTVPIPSIKNFKVKRSGKAFSFELGPTKMVFDSENAREIEEVVKALQKIG
jgi:hypothetical protein